MTFRFCCVSLITLSAFIQTTSCAPSLGVVPNANAQLKTEVDSRFHIGDIWEYKTRHGQERSHFTVLKVETSPDIGIIVHIAVDNLHWRTCQGDVMDQHVPHMPFARKAIDASAVRVVARNAQLPDYKEGYEMWRESFLKGHAGVYSISVQDAVTIAEESWHAALGCGHT